MTKPRVLVIAAEGLRRFIPALGAAAAIRSHHHDAEITVLTAQATASLAESSPYFNQVWIDDLRGRWDFTRQWGLRSQLQAQKFERIYDLDTSARSTRIFWLMYGLQGLPLRRRHLPWSGSIKHTALAPETRHWHAMHTLDRWASQLSAAGISGMLRPDLSWVARNVQSFNVPFRMHEPFILMAADSGPGLSWPVSFYADLAQSLHNEGLIPVLVGFNVLPEFSAALTRACGPAVNLIDQVSPEDLVFLSWAASAAMGPDSGTMHLTSSASCHSVILYDAASDPALVGQRGDSVVILRRPHLEDISVGEVVAAIRKSSKIGGI